MAALPPDVAAALIEQGVEAWHETSAKMLNELAAGDSEWAIATRERIFDAVQEIEVASSIGQG